MENTTTQSFSGGVANPTPVSPRVRVDDSTASQRGLTDKPAYPTAEELVELINNSNKIQPDKTQSEFENEAKGCSILIVDDEPLNIKVVAKYLKNAGYESVSSLTDAREAFPVAKQSLPDLILLDIHMPHLNGLQILHAMNRDWELKRIPVIILTAEADQNIKTAALELGASDYIAKPVNCAELTSRVRNSLMVKKHFDLLGQQKILLEKTVKRRTSELYESRQQLILSLARAAEHRDNETGNHVIRVGLFAAIIARQMGWDDDAVEMIQQAAQLHDVGKIGISDSILFKPGKLDEDEYNLMKKHCALGKNIIAPYDPRDQELVRSHARLGEGILHIRRSPLMMMAARIAQTHHERWDGTGYPLGLAGEDIPIEGRIVAIADVYDALSSKRPYKDPFPREKCFKILTESRGTHFDPDVLDAFFDCSQEIINIQMTFMDD